MRAHLYQGFVWPDTEFHALPIHDSRRTNSRKQNQAHSGDPRQSNARRGHPVAIVLAMCDGMHDLEVAFQGNYHETSSLRRHCSRHKCQTFKEYTDCAVENTGDCRKPTSGRMTVTVRVMFLNEQLAQLDSSQLHIIRLPLQVLSDIHLRRCQELRRRELRYRCTRSRV